MSKLNKWMRRLEELQQVLGISGLDGELVRAEAEKLGKVQIMRVGRLGKGCWTQI